MMPGLCVPKLIMWEKKCSLGYTTHHNYHNICINTQCIPGHIIRRKVNNDNRVINGNKLNEIELNSFNTHKLISKTKEESSVHLQNFRNESHRCWKRDKLRNKKKMKRRFSLRPKVGQLEREKKRMFESVKGTGQIAIRSVCG